VNPDIVPVSLEKFAEIISKSKFFSECLNLTPFIGDQFWKLTVDSALFEESTSTL
jgi:hypothetical protein